ncbi:MAG TPA: hypothetical protein VEX13_00720 [Chloroflexia bacterium]|nr:hypothetical protein [Chloroflexia bacterium]
MMATQSTAQSSAATEYRAGHVEGASFDRFAGMCAILGGVAGLLYSVSFVIISRTSPDLGVTLYSLFLLLGGLLNTAVLVALYHRLRDTSQPFAMWGVALGVAAAVGSIIHGGYDLANAINPPANFNLDLPSQIDPRGLLTFGVAGISIFVLSGLITRNEDFPKALGFLGYAVAAMLLIIYIGRLVILDATNPAIVVPALLTGFLLNPAWYIWVGMVLLRRGRT